MTTSCTTNECRVSCKKFFIAFVSVWALTFLCEWILHGKILGQAYLETASLWRTEADMQSYFPFLTLAQALGAGVFCYIFKKGFENKGVMEGVRFGLVIGFFYSSMNLITYAVQPMPSSIVIMWTVGSFIESILAGILLSFIYKK
ncbi:MAG: hypothetical protein KBD63_07865 [Bacteriovoracaceae bacterium]|nr:hypothetical protein [Bacteriovoracaceae bacterium]